MAGSPFECRVHACRVDSTRWVGLCSPASRRKPVTRLAAQQPHANSARRSLDIYGLSACVPTWLLKSSASRGDRPLISCKNILPAATSSRSVYKRCCRLPDDVISGQNFIFTDHFCDSSIAICLQCVYVRACVCSYDNYRTKLLILWPKHSAQLFIVTHSRQCLK